MKEREKERERELFRFPPHSPVLPLGSLLPRVTPAVDCDLLLLQSWEGVSERPPLCLGG